MKYTNKFSTQASYDEFILNADQASYTSLVNGVVKYDKVGDYLTFTCVEDGGISLSNYGGNKPNIEYSKNGGAWTVWNYSNIPLVAGDILKINGKNTDGFSKSTSKYSQFVMTGKIAASGNIMTLINKSGDVLAIPSLGCFFGLFTNCSSLTSAPELPATGLTESCYERMFSGCTSLVTGPSVLPARMINFNKIYKDMFMGCTSLTSSPEILCDGSAPGYWGCENMFKGCTNLSRIVCLEKDGEGLINGFYFWVQGVSATGTFVKHANATFWSTGDDGIPSGWTVEIYS